MNRGFSNNSGAQGRPSNFGGGQGTVVDYRERANQSDRRYDNFYGGGGGTGGANNRNVSNGGNNNNRNINWNGPQSQQRQQGFNQQNQARGGGVVPLNTNGQLLSAIQQQSIINALVSNNQQQQQQNMRLQQQNNQLQGNQFRRPAGGVGNRGGYAGGFNARAGDKRSMAQSGNFNNRQAGKTAPGKYQPKKPREGVKNSPKPKVPPKTVPKSPAPAPKAPVVVVEAEDEIEIPDEEVEVPDSLMEMVEKLRMRTGEIERNAVDEDVEKLSTFSCNGKGYHCITCDIVLLKQVSFNNHLNHKSHVMKVIDARTSKNYKATRAILDIDLSKDAWFEESELARNIILKQAKADMRQKRAKELKEKEEYNKKPSNFYRFNMEMRKCVQKQDDEVIITSLVESTVGVKDFTGGKFFGCEFVRAVTGFHCRLCSINIREAKGVLPHIETNLHKKNYAKYLVNNPDYEKMQTVQNQDLDDIMLQHEGKSVALAESSAAESSRFLSCLDNEVVRIPSVMNPEIKKKEAEDKAKLQEATEPTALSEQKSNIEEEGENTAGKQDEEVTEAEAEGETDGVEVDDQTEEEDVGNKESEEGTNDAEGEKAEDEVVESEESIAEKDEEVVTEETMEESNADAEVTEELTFIEDAPDATVTPDATTEETSSPKSAKGKGKKGGGKVKGK